MNDGALDEVAAKAVTEWAHDGLDNAYPRLMEGMGDVLMRRDRTQPSEGALERHEAAARAVVADQVEAFMDDERIRERIVADCDQAMQAIRALDGPLVRMVYQPGPVFRDACDGIMRLQATLLAKYGYGANR